MLDASTPSGSARDLHRPIDGRLSSVAIEDEVLLRGARSYPCRNHRYETDDGQQPIHQTALMQY